MDNHAPLINPPLAPIPPRWRLWLIISCVVVLGAAIAVIIWRTLLTIQPTTAPLVIPSKSTEKPTLTAEAVVSGYDHIWDIAFLPTNDMIFTERKGTIHLVHNDSARKIATIPDVIAQGEGGLLGVEVDPAFAENRYIYTCFNSSNGSPRDVRLVRWTLNAELTSVGDRKDILTGMPAAASGRHSGCRAKFGPDGYLYVGTGDAAQGNAGIDHKNLGGKILRIDRDGNAAPDNLGGDFDPRVFSYGHRNVQGVAFFDVAQDGAPGITIEHGSTVDDEVNLLVKGNFGWAPQPGGYVETNVPMTNKVAYPDALDAIWSSGSPTIAPSGATFLRGKQWKAWEGSLVIAVLKGKHLKFMALNEKNQVTGTEDLFSQQFGRLRTAVQAPDGALYLSTDNGGNDQIIRVTPQ